MTNAWSGLSVAISAATPDQCPELMGQLERLKACLWLKMTIGPPQGPAGQPDRLLTAKEVAERLKVTVGFVYRNARSYPFMVRQGRYIRFSNNGLEQHLKRLQRR